MSDNNPINNHLKELGKSDYEISEGQSDIRGWLVKNEKGQLLGKVNDLILDTQSKKIKYLILDMDGNELYLQVRKVLLPLNITELDEVYKNVICPGLLANEISSLPSYEKGKITSNVEDITASVFASGNTLKSRQAASPSSETPVTPVTSGTYSQMPGYAHASTSAESQVKKQVVVGLFEYTSEAQSAVAYLKESGFDNKNIEITYRDRNDFEHGDENNSMSGFFSRLFSWEESNWLNSEEAKFYSVVAVDHLSMAEAERAAEILDRHGAINIDDEFKAYRSKYLAENTERRNQKYRSRIISNPENNSKTNGI
ncbi:PRC-barrel domain-containing protein [Desertivirga xinjiangensis]|uniref:PRC-barrel domain-containing protein n=1 Tax=Desertivirga xinjiangensis TaxID=539206 RepID=UPI002108977F|nr:PRC-barrel domain-containing protein [Pedobacter xinjiangensis]